ncbi:MAG TPA: aldehyde dehydrogenase family protein [Acidimicrobiales bacterium]|nr:aldehyde dehydrogenase family protein [Acidimicrobiales bacterium]
MPEYDRLFIGGEWVPPAVPGTVTVRSPADGTTVGTIPEATEADADRAVAAARRAFDEGPWPTTPLADRLAVLRRMRDHLAGRVDDLDQLGPRENGVPVVVRAGRRGLELFDFTLAAAEEYPFESERTGMMGRHGTIVREPGGVVAAIVAGNGPLLQSVGKVAPALVCGCTAVLKPPPETPFLALALAHAAEEAGLPAGVLNVVPGGVAVGRHLVAHPGVDVVTFTGSAAAGRDIGQVCGAQLKRLTLELGGKSAAVVLDDADRDTTARAVAMDCMAFAGQRCAALSRVLVPASRYDEMVDALAGVVAGLAVGDPLDPSTYVGPLLTDRQVERARAYVESAVAGGARVVSGGNPMAGPDGSHFFEPTVLADVTNDMPVAREEIFGPVLVVIPYGTEEQAVALANDSQYGLSGAVFSSDPVRADRVARSIRAGSVGINATPGQLGLPFGGYKASGFGREYSLEAFDSFTEVKAIS